MTHIRTGHVQLYDLWNAIYFIKQALHIQVWPENKILYVSSFRYIKCIGCDSKNERNVLLLRRQHSVGFLFRKSCNKYSNDFMDHSNHLRLANTRHVYHWSVKSALTMTLLTFSHCLDLLQWDHSLTSRKPYSKLIPHYFYWSPSSLVQQYSFCWDSRYW